MVVIWVLLEAKGFAVPLGHEVLGGGGVGGDTVPYTLDGGDGRGEKG